MKKFKNITTLLLLLVFLFSTTSCVVLYQKDNRPHKKGWFKNPNNPHNPNSTNPWKTKGKSHK